MTLVSVPFLLYVTTVSIVFLLPEAEAYHVTETDTTEATIETTTLRTPDVLDGFIEQHENNNRVFQNASGQLVDQLQKMNQTLNSYGVLLQSLKDIEEGPRNQIVLDNTKASLDVEMKSLEVETRSLVDLSNRLVTQYEKLKQQIQAETCHVDISRISVEDSASLDACVHLATVSVKPITYFISFTKNEPNSCLFNIITAKGCRIKYTINHVDEDSTCRTMTVLDGFGIRASTKSTEIWRESSSNQLGLYCRFSTGPSFQQTTITVQAMKAST